MVIGECVGWGDVKERCNLLVMLILMDTHSVMKYGK